MDFGGDDDDPNEPYNEGSDDGEMIRRGTMASNLSAFTDGESQVVRVIDDGASDGTEVQRLDGAMSSSMLSGARGTVYTGA